MINVGINPARLPDLELLNELKYLQSLPKIHANYPDKYILDNYNWGRTQIRFFIDKSDYTFSRYQTVFGECVRRGFACENKSKLWELYPRSRRHHWYPSERETSISILKLKAYLLKKATPIRFYGDIVTYKQIEKILTVGKQLI